MRAVIYVSTLDLSMLSLRQSVAGSCIVNLLEKGNLHSRW